MGVAVSLVVLLAGSASAERAWVKDEHQINVRSGPGVQFRVIGTIVTGDAVDILERGEGWTEVRPDEVQSGWIRSGFLQESPPARVVLAEVSAEKARLERKLAELTAAESKLREDRDAATQRDSAQQQEIERLTHENISLRAGARWPEWLTGAGIVLVGMLLGAIVARGSGRRRQQRIKL